MRSISSRPGSIGTLVLLSCLSCSTSSFGQTTLSVGEVSFIAVQTDATNTYTIVPWATLQIGTVIKFTDNGIANANATLINDAEVAWIFTTTSTIPAGTPISFTYAGNPLKWNAASGGTVSNNLLNDDNPGSPSGGIGTNGDQIFIYQGAGNTIPNIQPTQSPPTFTGSLIAGINFGDIISSGSMSVVRTYEPTVLANNRAFTNVTNVDNAYYVGTRSGLTKALFQASTFNASNFQTSGSPNGSYDHSTAFTIAATASALWDPNGTTAGTGGTGTWDSTTNNRFSNSANTTFFRWVNSSAGNDHTAVFGGTAGTVTIASGGVTASGLTFDMDGYTLTNSTITLSGSNPALTVAAGSVANVDASLAGVVGFTKAGSGMLILTADNSASGLSGDVTINAGTLRINNTTGSGTGTGLVHVVDGTLDGIGAVEDLHVDLEGTLAPGNSIGILTVLGNATIDGELLAEVVEPDADLLVVGGDLTLGAASILSLPLTNSYDANATYPLISFSGTRIGTFLTTENLPPTHQLAYSSNLIALVPIPEPGGFILASCGILATLLMLRRPSHR